MSTRRSLPPIRGAVATPEKSSIDSAPARRKKRLKPKQTEEDEATVVADSDVNRLQSPKRRTVKKQPPVEEGAGDAVFDESKPKRKPKQKKPVESEAAVEETAEQPTSKKRRPRAKKKSPEEEAAAVPEHEMSTDLLAELAEIKEEVLEQDTKEEGAQTTASEKRRPIAVVSGTMMKSQPSAFMYIEHKTGFKNLDRGKAVRQRAERSQKEQEPEEEAPPPVGSSLVFAIKIHSVFKAMALIFQGLLAGISLMLILLSFMEQNRKTSLEIVAEYKVYTPGFQSMFFVLLCIALVSSLSRHDIASPSRRMVKRAFTLQSAAVCILFYLLALVASLSNAALDDAIGLYGSNVTYWRSENEATPALREWTILNTIRCGASILGFIAVCINPAYDRFKKSLHKVKHDIGSGAMLELEGLND